MLECIHQIDLNILILISHFRETIQWAQHDRNRIIKIILGHAKLTIFSPKINRDQKCFMIILQLRIIQFLHEKIRILCHNHFSWKFLVIFQPEFIPIRNIVNEWILSLERICILRMCHKSQFFWHIMLRIILLNSLKTKLFDIFISNSCIVFRRGIITLVSVHHPTVNSICNKIKRCFPSRCTDKYDFAITLLRANGIIEYLLIFIHLIGSNICIEHIITPFI